MNFAVPADHRVKLKESEKKDKYLHLAWELKKLWNIKVTFIPFVIVILGTVTEGLIKRLEDLEINRRVENIQITAWENRPEYWEESWRLEKTCCPSNSCERLSANTDVKISVVVTDNFPQSYMVLSDVEYIIDRTLADTITSGQRVMSTK